MFQIQTFFYNKMQKWEQQTRNEFCCTDLSFMAFFDTGCLIWLGLEGWDWVGWRLGWIYLPYDAVAFLW